MISLEVKKSPYKWTFVTGSENVNSSGNYGTKGQASPSNIPPPRYLASSWVDKSNNFWIFGGCYYFSNLNENLYNDLWKFDGTNWTWVSGSDKKNSKGSYGVQGISSETNLPHSRYGASYWLDSEGSFWLFGGHGYDVNKVLGGLDDLWKYSNGKWAWFSGTNYTNYCGIYNESNENYFYPGSRMNTSSWQDNSGNLWLFGGLGFGKYYDGVKRGNLNDLWKLSIN